MIGVLYNEVNKYREWLPTYPTAWQRFIVWIKNLFSREEDESVNMLALTCQGRPEVLSALDVLADGLVYPTIERVTKAEQGWYVTITAKANFLKVASGHRVRYYSMTVAANSLYDNTFYNVERIISETGDRDDIHKKAKKKAVAA
jgi:hypothetical protein|tara:strand:+ start:505 stop:939 length:435 start_codon:yes stop_codon:yes gene_type:complete